MKPSLAGLFPKDTVLAIGSTDGSIIVPNVSIFRTKETDPAVQLQYVIKSPNGTTVWESRNAAGTDNWVDVPVGRFSSSAFECTFSNARGSMA